ncbi:ABC transporter family substrate-binding protein [Kutzneria sp. NPDC051319]|uniref:ABC transporter family substrate-binding protein n=1 Tax=Kutzneria sp. NPDC051319 TaxID=3155047 RepID=UPI003430F6AA
MRRSKAIPAIAVMAGAALMLTACGGSSGGGQDNGSGSGGLASAAIGKGESGDTYTAPKVNDIGPVVVSTDKPFTAYNNATADAVQSYNSYALIQVLARPFVLDGNNKVLLNKDVMDSVEVTSTSPKQVVTWKIKKGVTWSDGAAWNCKDFYLAWLAQSGTDLKPDGKTTYFLPGGTTGYSQIDSAKCQDDQTFVTEFSSPFGDWKSLFGISDDLLPAHVLEKQTGVSDITQVTPKSPADILTKVSDFWNTGWKGFKADLAPGSGAYMISDWQQGSSITLVRNPKWAGNPGGPAKITLKAIPDSNAQVQALQNNEEQVLSSAQPDANAAQTLQGLGSSGITYGANAGLNFEHLDLNLKRPIFQDEAVRKAFGQCINRNELVDKLIKQVQPDAKPFNSVIFFPGMPGYADNYSDKLISNPATAKATLTSDGWAPGPDGIMAKGGQKLSFKISHTDIPRRKQTVALLQQECKAAGIDIQDDTDANFLDKRVSDSDYDVALFAWSVAPFHSAGITTYKTGGNQNWNGTTSPAADAAFAKALSQTDDAAAVTDYQTADKAIADTYSTFPLFQPPNMWAYTGDIDKAYFQSYYGSMWNANEWQKPNA